MRKLLLILTLLSLFACRHSPTAKEAAQGDTLRLKYAEHIHLVRHAGYTVAELTDPWNQGKVLHTYVLVPADEELPAHLPKGTVVRTPLKRAVVATSVHCGLIGSMGKATSIKGVCDVRYINLAFVAEGLKRGSIADCGSGLQPTLETIIDLQPDAIFLSPFQNSGGYGRIEELDVPIVETADYMETSALGRAEWMKFYGMLFGAEEQADSIFSEVEKHYLELCDLAKTASGKPSLIMDRQTGSVWYVPGGQSTVGKVIQDANIAYPWAGEKKSGSLSLPFESILEKAGDADYWLFRYNSPKPMTLKMLLQDNPGYAQFKPFKTGEVYGCNTDVSTFYEDTPFHPDLLLLDIMRITHPDLGLGSPHYFIKLSDK